MKVLVGIDDFGNFYAYEATTLNQLKAAYLDVVNTSRFPFDIQKPPFHSQELIDLIPIIKNRINNFLNKLANAGGVAVWYNTVTKIISIPNGGALPANTIEVSGIVINMVDEAKQDSTMDLLKINAKNDLNIYEYGMNKLSLATTAQAAIAAATTQSEFLALAKIYSNKYTDSIRIYRSEDFEITGLGPGSVGFVTLR